MSDYPDALSHPRDAAQLWAAANEAMVKKMIEEYSYENLLTVVHLDDDRYEIRAPAATYRFSAIPGAFGSIRVKGIVTRIASGDRRGTEIPTAIQLLLDTVQTADIGSTVTSLIAEELLSTLTSDMKILQNSITAQQMQAADIVELDAMQTGHPWVVANKGRLGMVRSSVEQYCPESRTIIRLAWLAVHREICAFDSVPELTYLDLIRKEIGSDGIADLERRILHTGRDPDEYMLLPVHPWQYDARIRTLFAHEESLGNIIFLGTHGDRYAPQQSIRTMTNVDHSDKFNVKLPLSILNTVVWRGLPTDRTRAAAPLTTWLRELIDGDEELSERSRRIVFLGEVASLVVPNRTYESIDGAPYRYMELLGALWRESLPSRLRSNEAGRTLASLLYRDANQTSLVSLLISNSNMHPRDWLERLVDAVFIPSLHLLCKYGVAVVPHGENASIIFDEMDRPVGVALKDFVDDINLYENRPPFPELATTPNAVERTLRKRSAEHLIQSLYAGLLVGNFRYLARIMDEDGSLQEMTFWSVVADRIKSYQSRHPELSERFQLFDFLAPSIKKLCLNRYRMQPDSYRDCPERPSDVYWGTLPNPLSVTHNHVLRYQNNSEPRCIVEP